MNNVSHNSDKIFLHKQWDNRVYRYKLDIGSIIMMPKPPRGIQLPSFIEYLKDRDVNSVVSLLQFDEVNALGLANEASECRNFEIEYLNFQIKDHGTPKFFVPYNQLIEKLASDVQQGKNIAIHCYAGIGRTGLTAASILIKLGMQVDMALIDLSGVRGLRVPETLEQITWLHHYSEQLKKNGGDL